MVFSSVPLYLDPPSWHQQHPSIHNQGGTNETHNFHLPPAPPPDKPGASLFMGGPPATSAIRPNSMAERARLANIPVPEGPLLCPRCESSDTKFCYFNNYSLSQPRHFCKTCRRYWTRGGSLRNVPVGGGCRRSNKRRKSSRPKSPATDPRQTRPVGPADPAGGFGPSGGSHVLQAVGPAEHQLSLMASLQNLTQLGMGNLGSKFGGQFRDDSCPRGTEVDQPQRQLPLWAAGFGAGLPSSNSLYPFQNGGMGTVSFR